jgi:hypothetical protein
MGFGQIVRGAVQETKKMADEINPVLINDDEAVYEQEEFEPVENQNYQSNNPNIQNNTFYSG